MEDIVKLLYDIYSVLVPFVAMFTILFMFLIGYLAFKFVDKFELVRKEKNKNE